MNRSTPGLPVHHQLLELVMDRETRLDAVYTSLEMYINLEISCHDSEFFAFIVMNFQGTGKM